MGVDNAGSSAAAGVQQGWGFKKIGAESLDGYDYRKCMDMLKKGIDPLPKSTTTGAFSQPGAFVMEFQAGAERKAMAFTKKPFGMTFDSKVPVIIKSVSGHAQELGVQAG